MKVVSLHLVDVGPHRDTKIELPASGLVLVVGENGSGKSTLWQSAGLAGWGKREGGRSLWRDGSAQGRIEMETVNPEGGAATVVRQLKTPKLTVSGIVADTPTKGQDLINANLGTYEDWRRSCVVTAVTSRALARQTDAERKRSIERAVALDHMDVAQRAALDGVRSAKAALERAQDFLAAQSTRVTDADAARSRANTALKEHDARSTEGESSEVAGQRVKELKEQHRKATDSWQEADAKLKMAETRYRKASRDDDVASRRWQATQTGECDQCGQSLPPQDIESSADELKQISDTLGAETMRLHKEMITAQLAEQQAEEWVRTAQSALSVANAQEAAAKAREEVASRGRDPLVREVARAEKAHADREEEYLEAQCERDVAKQTLTDAQDVAALLGPGGIRPRLLEDAVAAVDLAAKAWAVRMRHAMTPEIKLVDDQIEITVGPRPYVDASTGQQSRADIAIALALAEVGEQATARQPGTLWVDEAFDLVDDAGVADMAEALAEYATDRCVVVVAHRAADAVRQQATKVIRLRDGRVF